MKSEEIKKLVAKSENAAVEFKRARGGVPADFWPSYSAFANTDGGTIIIGIREKDGKRKESVIAKQVLRSGTSIGANIAESRYAQSKSDFASKLQIALKEAAETQYWLELLRDAELVDDDAAFASLCDDCTELIKLLTASVKTAKQ